MLLVLELKVLKKNKRISEQDIEILLRFLQSDASIKKLNNIYIPDIGYKFNGGTMIGCNLLNDPGLGNFVLPCQVDGKIYATYGYNWSDGFSFKNYSSYANVIYI